MPKKRIWKRGQDYPNSGPEFMFAELNGKRYTIRREVRVGDPDPWYTLYRDGNYVSSGWTMRDLKRTAEAEQAPKEAQE